MATKSTEELTIDGDNIPHNNLNQVKSSQLVALSNAEPIEPQQQVPLSNADQSTFEDLKPKEYDTGKPNFAAIFFFEKYGSGRDLTRCSKNVKELAKVLPHFGYDVAINETDISAEDFTSRMEEWKTHDFSSFNQFFLLIVAHGDENGFEIPPTNTSSTNSEVAKETSVKYAYIEKCIAENTKLAGKPKWLVFACCHGNDTMPSTFAFSSGDEGSSAANVSNAVKSIPIRSDFLVTYATVQGYTSFYDDNGMVLLDKILKRLSQIKEKTKDGYCINILKFLTLVNADVAEYVAVNKTDLKIDGGKQMCEIRSTLTRTLYLKFRKVPVSQSKITNPRLSQLPLNDPTGPYEKASALIPEMSLEEMLKLFELLRLRLPNS